MRPRAICTTGLRASVPILMVRALAAIERGTLTLTPQPQAGVTYARKIGKDETRIAWAQPWQEVHNHIRGLSPFPGAWFEDRGGGRPRIKVLRSDPRRGLPACPGTVLDDELTVACAAGRGAHPRIAACGPSGHEGGRVPRGTTIAAGTRFG